MRTIVYVDGGSSPNPGPGGWGVVIVAEGGNVELCGGEAGPTTNNRMELTAAIMALGHFPAGAAIEIRSDSQYVVNAVTEWMPGWKRKRWLNVKNVDLMKRLDELAAARDVRWIWVRGHAGDPLNERADALVHQGRRQARSAGAKTIERAKPAPPAEAAPVVGAAQLPVDLALGLEIDEAAKAAGIRPESIVSEALRLYLDLGPRGVERARDYLRRRAEAA